MVFVIHWHAALLLIVWSELETINCYSITSVLVYICKSIVKWRKEQKQKGRIQLTIFFSVFGETWLPWWLNGWRIHLRSGDTGAVGLLPRLGKFPGEGNGNPLQYSCLKNPMDSGAWWGPVHGVTKRQDWVTKYSYKAFAWSCQTNSPNPLTT